LTFFQHNRASVGRPRCVANLTVNRGRRVRGMRDPTHYQLLGYLLGALEDEEQECLDRRFEQDGDFRRKLGQWRQCLTPLEPLRHDIEPPPGLAERTCQLVAACRGPLATPEEADSYRPNMTPDEESPAQEAHVARLDTAMVFLLLLLTCLVLFPAISNSRFHARGVSCQDRLWQFGQAFLQYNQQRGGPISQLAARGNLTPTGIFAASRIKDGFAAGAGEKAPYSEDWLAAENASWRSRVIPTSRL